MKRIAKWLARIGIVLLVIVIILAGVGTWLIRRPWPKVKGNIEVAGLSAPVEVIRDAWGVPHIYAQNEHDLFFAQGYVHAQDRLWQMELNRHISSGRLSEIVGRVGINTDRLVRSIGLRRSAERAWATLDNEEARAILQAYTDGVNAYLETHRNRLPVEFIAMGVEPEPWTPVDSVTWGNMMSLTLGSNYRLEFLRAKMTAEFGAKVTQQLMHPPVGNTPMIIPPEAGSYEGLRLASWEVFDEADEWLGDPALSWGSNNWVVHGSRTESGMPILANDTHLGLQAPSTWYENGLHGGRFDCVGFTFPGVPLVVVGHNQHIAWGTTNLGPDVQDLYLEKLDNLDNPTQYEFKGEWHDLEILHETIKVKGGEPVALDIYLTQHGPLLNKALERFGNEPLAFRWTLYESETLLKSLMLINLATNWDEFYEALRYWDAPGQNFVYADVEGNISYHATGKIPIRVAGHQGLVPVPGWTGEYEWQGFVPFDELPYAVNPSTGFLVTANNKIVSDDYPYLLAYDWYPGYRAKRITDLLAADDQITLEDMQRIHADTFSLPAEMLRPYLLALQPQNERQAQALEEVRAWDLHLEADRVGASIYQVWYLFMLRNTIDDELGEDFTEEYMAGNYHRHGSMHLPMMVNLMAEPEDPWFDDSNTPEIETRDDIAQRSLAEALDWLGERYGEDMESWQWGRLHTVKFVNIPLGRTGIPPIDWLFNSPTMPARGDNFTVNGASFDLTRPFTMIHGSSQRMVVDMSALDNSLSVFPPGQSGLGQHKHYQDQVQMWQNVEYRPLLFSRQAVEADAQKEVLTLTPP